MTRARRSGAHTRRKPHAPYVHHACAKHFYLEYKQTASTPKTSRACTLTVATLPRHWQAVYILCVCQAVQRHGRQTSFLVQMGLINAMGRSWIWSGTARATSRIPTSLVAFGCAPLSSSPSLPPSLCLSLPKAPKLANQKAPHCQHLLAYAHDASIRAHVAGELQALRAVAGQLRERGQGPAAAEPLHQVQHGAASPAPGDAAVPADLFPPLPHLPGPHTRSRLQLGCSAWFCSLAFVQPQLTDKRANRAPHTYWLLALQARDLPSGSATGVADAYVEVRPSVRKCAAQTRLSTRARTRLCSRVYALEVFGKALRAHHTFI